MKLSIKWTLIIGFLGLIWGTHVITATSSFLTSQEVLRAHARDIMENIAALAMEQSQRHLLHAHSAAALTKRLLTSHVVGKESNKFDALERYFYNQLEIYPHFAGIYIGTPEGNFYDVRRYHKLVDDGFRTKVIQNDKSGRKTELIWRDRHFNVIKQQSTPDGLYDPRKRPWYKKAIRLNDIVWTDPYIFFTSKKPGITIAGPFHDANGTIKGVVGVDIEIDQLSTFIGNLKIGKHGRAFMLNRNADVVAFPDQDKLEHPADDGSGEIRLVKIEEINDVLSRKAYRAVGLKKDKDGMIIINKPHFARFNHDGDIYLTMFSPFSTKQWPWIIGVHIPEDDYLGAIKANRTYNLIVTLLISIFATLLGLLLARGVIKPISMLNEESKRIKDNDFESKLKITSIYKEIQVTADSFAGMKKAVKRSRKKYRGIFENIQDVYFEASAKGTIIEISPSIEKVSLYKRRELIGTSLYSIYSDPTKKNKIVHKIIRKDKINDDEVILKDKNGDLKYFSLNAALLRSRSGKPLRVIGSLRNITARKQAENKLIQYRNHLKDLVKERTQKLENSNRDLVSQIKRRKNTEKALRESEEKYRSILDDIKEGYFELDLSGNITFVNDAACDITGFSHQEFMGMNFRQIIDEPDEEKTLVRTFMQMFKTGNPTHFNRYHILTKNKGKRIAEFKVSVMNDRNGEIIGFRGVARDQTERVESDNTKKKLEEQLNHAQRMEAVGTLAGGIAHDFNNLLMGIQGNTSLLSLKMNRHDPLYNNIEAIETCVQSGASLTRQLLGYARGGKYIVSVIDLNDTVKRTVALFGRTKKEIRITGKYQKNIWMVEADQGQIDQVLVNLYVNAWQAMTDQMGLYLETANVVLGDNFTRAFGVEPGKYVKISVRDKGLGMDKSTLKRIFEPFFTTKMMGGGTGLGLASAFGIIKNHDGIIDVESSRGKGSIFSIYLPATKKDKPIIETQPDRSVSSQKGNGTILVVDDEKYILDSMKVLLEDLGYTVFTANGGEKAVNRFRRNKELIDLVLLDMVMPDMSGSRVFDLIKTEKPDIKVVISSGYSIESIPESLPDNGYTGFIQKPYNITRLTAMIDTAISNKEV